MGDNREAHFRVVLDPSAYAAFFSPWQSCAKELWSLDCTITAESSRAHWLIFIVNKRTDTDRHMKFLIYAILTQRTRAENLKSQSVTFKPIEIVRFFY